MERKIREGGGRYVSVLRDVVDVRKDRADRSADKARSG